MRMLDKCPGAAAFRRPTIVLKTCPRCGEEIEMFSDDAKGNCSRCGFIVYNDALSCVQWCEYAKQCVGEEVYNELMQRLKHAQT
jgi:ribosomal protein S27AE